MRARKLVIFGVMAAAVAAGGYYYYFVYSPAKLAANSAQSLARVVPPAPVMVAQVSQEVVPVQFGTVGSVQQYTTVSVKSLVDGQIFKAGFEEGQYVHK
ncbi:MAG TPA: efflux RND transporter periplasmic adaptor subunit, partial [Alphaproteobacteria bacterium]